MSGWEDDLVDPFMAELPAEDVEALVATLEGAASVSPAQGARAQLLSQLSGRGRFDRFAETVGALLDLTPEHARTLLDGIGDPASWYDAPLPDVSLYDLDKGPSVKNAITGFVRMPAGAVFPEHEHLGDEAVLVVQGSYVDGVSGRIHRAGDLVRLPPGTSHDFRVRPGPDLVYLAVVQKGIKIGDDEIGPNDPRM